MSGFFVSNSFGHFNGETKKFNATITYPGGPAEATLEELWDYPHQTGKRTHFGGKYPSDESASGGWAYKKFHYYYKGNYADAGTGSNTTDRARIFPWTVKDSTSVKDRYYRGGSGDAVHYTAMPNTITKFKMTVYNNGPEMLENVTYGGTDYGKTLIEACNDSSIVCLQNYKDKGDGKAEYEVYLYGDDGDYFSIDMDGNVSDVASYKMKTKCGTYSLKGSIPPGGRYTGSGWKVHQAAATLRSITYVKKGCTDAKANNTTTGATEDDGSCKYTTASISSFTAAPTNPKVGDTVTLSWNLSNTNFTEVKILHNGNNIMPNAKKNAKNSSIPVTPSSAGTKTYTLKVSWVKPNAETRTANLNVPVVSAISYVPCDPLDVHRNVDGNGECAGCKTGYNDITTDFCTNCEATNEDPYRDMNTADGTCGDCMAGYAEDTNGTCQKVGCITFTDGTSASGDSELGAIHPGDYNYDPDAVTNDSSLCENPDGAANGGNGGNGGTPDVDCELSDWSDWSEWSDATTASGTRTRTRTVVTGQSGGGAVCPSLEETETGVVDPNTGTVTITTMGGDSEPVETTTETKSLAAPLIIGGIVLTIGLLVMRR